MMNMKFKKFNKKDLPFNKEKCNSFEIYRKEFTIDVLKDKIKELENDILELKKN